MSESTFMRAMGTEESRQLFNDVNALGTTFNGAVTHLTSGSKCVDFFFVGATLIKDAPQFQKMFNAAYAENAELAVRILLYIRDVREGAGLRNSPREVIKELCSTNPALAARVLSKMPELGRWDDMLVAFGTPLQGFVMTIIMDALTVSKNALCGKWMPRRGPVFNALFRMAGVSPKEMRKYLVSLTNVVEHYMYPGKWELIDFSKLPSQASSRYQKTFWKNAPETYGQYVEALKKGVPTVKVNAGAIYPHEIMCEMRSQSNKTVSDAQWKALPNYMAGSTERIIPVVDVSGSMDTPIAGRATAKDIAISLGLYIAERNEGLFKNEFISFSSDPHFHHVTGETLSEKYRSMVRSGENMSTNLWGTFKVLLDRAVKAKLPQSAMPNKVLILSDMEFDVVQRYESGSYGYRSGGKVTNYQAIKDMYARAGYVLPTMVFWNINGRAGNSPVTMGAENVALISGFNTSILKSLLGGKLDIASVILDAVGGPRYAF